MYLETDFAFSYQSNFQCQSFMLVRTMEDVIKPPPSSLLLTVLKLKTVFWCNSYFMLIRVGISCCISYSIVGYLLYALVDQLTSVGEERANFSAIV